MKLKDWMDKNKVTAKQLHQRLKYDKNYLYRMMREESTPGRKLAEMIEEYTNGEVTKEEMGYAEKEKCRCPTCGKIM